MSSTAAASPAASTPASRIPVQPSPGPALVSRSRTPGQSINTPPSNAAQRAQRQFSTGSSSAASGRALPIPGGGSVGRAATVSANRPSLQPLMESVTTDHRHGTTARVSFL